MKTITITLSLILLSFGIQAQTNVIDRHFSDLASLENVMEVSISGSMFQLANEIEADDEETREFIEAAKKIKGIKVLINEDDKDGGKDLLARVHKIVDGEFEELMRVKESDMEAVFFVKESNGIITELLGVVDEENEWILINVWGEIDLKQAGSMIRKMNFDGTDEVETKSLDLASNISVYPNPVGKDANVQMEVPEELVGSQVLVFNQSGAVVRDLKVHSKTQELRLYGLPSGNYVMKIMKGKEQAYTKKFIIQ
jgi:hypothetical protein